jgi:hypothetical protein
LEEIFTCEEISAYSILPQRCSPVRYRITSEGCWECVSHKRDKDGYIRLRRKGKDKYLHRLIYELKVGEIPENHEILHSCDNPACFNISHLSSGTNLDNQLDKVKKNRQARGVKNGRAKLTEDDVRAIRKDTRSGKKIGADYGISDAMVYDIKTFKNWKHVI